VVFVTTATSIQFEKWLRFAKSTCPVRTHYVPFLLNNLARCQLHSIIPFARYSAPRVHQYKRFALARYPQLARRNPRQPKVSSQKRLWWCAQNTRRTPATKTRQRAHDVMRPSELISRFLRADYFPFVPKLLPTPVTKSYPDLQLKLPAVPDTMSRKSLVPIFE
jgi:hypothetical protein